MFAFVSDVAAFVSDVAAAVALLADAVAEFAAAVADDAALFCAVVADAASTIKSQFAELVLVVNGCEPEDVCAVLQKKILFVDVSLTRSLTAYAVLAAQLPRYVPSSFSTSNSPKLSKPNTLFLRLAAFSVISKLPIVLVNENFIDLSISSCCC